MDREPNVSGQICATLYQGQEKEVSIARLSKIVGSDYLIGRTKHQVSTQAPEV